MDQVQAITTVQPAPLHNPPPPASDSAPSQVSKELQNGRDEPEAVTGASRDTFRVLVGPRGAPSQPAPLWLTSSPVSSASSSPLQIRGQAVPDKPALKRLAWLVKLLAVWIFLAMAVGIILGEFVPSTSVVLEKVKFVDVSLPLGKHIDSASLASHECAYSDCAISVAAIALIVMMWPILCRVSPTALVPLLRKRQLWQHLAFSVVINWIVSPLFMLGLAWAFLPDRSDLREGLIVVGVARCIAMVSSFSQSLWIFR